MQLYRNHRETMVKMLSFHNVSIKAIITLCQPKMKMEIQD